jgi:hypothetical protein
MDYIDRKDQGKHGAKTSPTPVSMSPEVKNIPIFIRNKKLGLAM